jgi:hypothetical protein
MSIFQTNFQCLVILSDLPIYLVIFLSSQKKGADLRPCVELTQCTGWWWGWLCCTPGRAAEEYRTTSPYIWRSRANKRTRGGRKKQRQATHLWDQVGRCHSNYNASLQCHVPTGDVSRRALLPGKTRGHRQHVHAMNKHSGKKFVKRRCPTVRRVCLWYRLTTN